MDKKESITENDNNELLEALTEIDEKLELAKKGLLLYEELKETQHRIQDILSRHIDHSTELWREYDRQNTTTYWEVYPRSKYTSETSRLPIWRGFIVKCLELQGAKPNKKQQLIQKGQYFTARQIVRKILEKAKNTIDIQDNYVNIELLAMLEPYIQQNQNLKIRILTQKIDNSFKSDLALFVKQYSVGIEVKLHQSCHDRFIVIDGNDVFHSGHSFKDLGSKASLINSVDDEEEKKKFIGDFDNWWLSGALL